MRPVFQRVVAAPAIKRLLDRGLGAPLVRWVIASAVTALCAIAAVLFLLWAFNGFEGLGIGATGTFALVLGVVCMIALGVALMALIFYSDRINIDEDAYYTVTGDGDGPHERFG